MATKSTTENTETPQPDKAPAPKRRTTRKSSKKTNRKTAPPAGKATKKTTRGTAAPADSQPAPAESAAQLDRSTLSEKTRVHALAKMLGVASRDLIVSLDEVGLVKVAQSVLTRSEADRVLDHLAGVTEPALVEHDEEPQPAADSQTEEKIRTRVRKNVANEIHQIEEKVEADLAAAVDEARHEDPLEDVTPEITPAPEEKPAATAYAPLFVPPAAAQPTPPAAETAPEGDDPEQSEERSPAATRRRTRRSTRSAASAAAPAPAEHSEQRSEHGKDGEDGEQAAQDLPTEPVALKGSTRLESQRRRRNEMREAGRKQKRVVSQAEFLARRESVERTMVVRERHRIEDPDHPGLITQVGVLEDDLLVEHFVTSDAQASIIGNIYLGRVQNVLPSMEAAFIDIGTGRNGVLYASEVDWKAAGLNGRSRRIEQALKSGDQVVVQVSKDPLGHKGARLTTQISLAGRYLVYVPGGRSAGISRKLPAPERKRLKDILSRVIPGQGGAIIRTAAENVPEEAIAADVDRLHHLWEDIQRNAEREKKSKGSQPVTLYEEPDILVKVIRDLFNEDFTRLVVDGKRSWNTVSAYVNSVAPDLADRLVRYDRREHKGQDAFTHFRVDEQLQKALHRKVWLPSGGSLVIDRTEAMTVVDVNTGKFTGSGGNLEETVTRNNLEAAEEIVRQMRLRDLGGMIVVDFIDMVLPENQDLVLRRLKEALGRDRTRHQVSEVTSLGLVQMTRKRLGAGLLETFSTDCETCGGRGLILHEDPVDHREQEQEQSPGRSSGSRSQSQREETKKTRAGRSAQQRPAPEETEENFREIAAAVIPDEGPADHADPDQQEEKAEARSGSRSSRRRGGRGRGRGRGRSHSHPGGEQQHPEPSTQPEEDTSSSSLSEVDAIVSAALETAKRADPEEPSDADYIADPDIGAGEKSFQQAVAEFERSPRRGRRTRGNSRSDHRPKREDFRDSTPAPAATSEPAAAPEHSKQAQAQVQPQSSRQQSVGQDADPQASSGRRGRRRAVRRSAPQSAQRGTREQPQSEAVAQPPAQEASPTKQDSSARSSGGRGRRRATRRRSDRSGT